MGTVLRLFDGLRNAITGAGTSRDARSAYSHFARNLTQAEQDAANKVPVSSLRDPQTLAERTKEGHENWLITMGVCTHLGCVPIGNEGEYAVVEGNAKHGGWFCPCHGSMYDTAGRIRKGPAPENLAIPQYAYLSDTKIRIG